MPTFVPSSFSSTMSDRSAINASDSFRPRCLSSSVPFEPKRCGVRGYLMKSSRVAPILRELLIRFSRVISPELTMFALAATAVEFQSSGRIRRQTHKFGSHLPKQRAFIPNDLMVHQAKQLCSVHPGQVAAPESLFIDH